MGIGVALVLYGVGELGFKYGKSEGESEGRRLERTEIVRDLNDIKTQIYLNSLDHPDTSQVRANSIRSGDDIGELANFISIRNEWNEKNNIIASISRRAGSKALPDD